MHKEVQTDPEAPSAPATSVFSSMRLSHVILRFGFISFASATLDNVLFFIIFRATGTIAGAQFIARACSVAFNYNMVKRSVFSSGERHTVLFPRYLMLAALNATLSYAGIRLVHGYSPVGVMPSKIIVETLLFLANFALQRQFVFSAK